MYYLLIVPYVFILIAQLPAWYDGGATAFHSLMRSFAKLNKYYIGRAVYAQPEHENKMDSIQTSV